MSCQEHAEEEKEEQAEAFNMTIYLVNKPDKQMLKKSVRLSK
jgi:hypothetical protein